MNPDKPEITLADCFQMINAIAVASAKMQTAIGNIIQHIQTQSQYDQKHFTNVLEELQHSDSLMQAIAEETKAVIENADESTTDTAAESGASDSQDSQKDSQKDVDSSKKPESFQQRMARLGGKDKNPTPDKVMNPEQLAKWITQNLIKIGEKGNEDVAELAYDLVDAYCKFHKVDAINELSEEHIPAVQTAFEDGFEKYFLNDAEDKHKFTALDVLVKSLEPTE